MRIRCTRRRGSRRRRGWMRSTGATGRTSAAPIGAGDSTKTAWSARCGWASGSERGCERELHLRGHDPASALGAPARVQPQAGAGLYRPRRAPRAARRPAGRPAAGGGALSPARLPRRSRRAAAARRARPGGGADRGRSRGSDPGADAAPLVRALLQPRELLLLLRAGGRAGPGSGRGGDEHALGRTSRLRDRGQAARLHGARRRVRQGAARLAVHGDGSSLRGPCGDARTDAVGPHRLEPRRRHRVRRDAGAAPPRADARVDGGDHAALPARDRPRPRADLRTRHRAQARGHARPPPSGGTNMSVWLSRRLVSLLLRRIEVGSLTVVEGDEQLVFGSGSPTATVRIASPRTWRMLLRGSRGMAEAFARGLWDSPDLVALIRLGARNAGGLDRLRSRLAPVRWPLQRAASLLRRSTKRRRRRDIAAHYDLGNDLFARMLDPTMSYSCALFEREGMTLEQAQVAKLERICEQLDLGPGDRVLEIGTGWGGFALHAAATR